MSENAAARSEVLEVAATVPVRRTANVLLSVIPGARHNPGKIAVPPPPDPLFEWSPSAYPATVAIDDDELATGFRSFGVERKPVGEKADLFVVAKGHLLTNLSYKGILKVAQEEAEWFVLMAETVQNWVDGRLEFEPRADGSASILGPIEWWISAIDNETSKLKLRHDLMWQAHILFHRQGVPRPLDTVLIYEVRPR